jgi:hydroxyacylglutathione hydrolase
MKLNPLPAFDDNYIWMLHDNCRALVVDPGDAEPVMQALQSAGLQLEGILVTHHHQDHTGGVGYLREATGAKVYGPMTEPMPEPLTRLSGGQRIHLLGLEFQVMDVPGHTAGHIAYFCESMEGRPLLFCGDTLFSGGCGRLFEGTAQQMFASLQSLAALPASTKVCCTHEYTLSNLKFACEVEPDNQDLIEYQATCRERRSRGEPTLPSSIGLEQSINPFFRSAFPSVVASARKFDAKGVDENGVFATLRQWKNQYQ